jgi:hypothetical protein
VTRCHGVHDLSESDHERQPLSIFPQPAMSDPADAYGAAGSDDLDQQDSRPKKRPSFLDIEEDDDDEEDSPKAKRKSRRDEDDEDDDEDDAEGEEEDEDNEEEEEEEEDRPRKKKKRKHRVGLTLHSK